MANDIRLLEDLVNKAVDRLKRLSAERSRLQQEVDELHERLETSDHARRSAGDDSTGWQQQRANVVTALRETLDELRGD